MLYCGERIGNGTLEPQVDIAVDPLDGTTSIAMVGLPIGPPLTLFLQHPFPHLRPTQQVHVQRRMMLCDFATPTRLTFQIHYLDRLLSSVYAIRRAAMERCA